MEKKHMASASPLVGLFLCTFLYPQQPPDAMQLLQRVSQTYRSLHSYEIRGTLIDDEQLDEATEHSEIPLVMAEDKSGKFRIETRHPFTGGAEVSDGKTTWKYLAMRHQYTKKPASQDAGVPEEGSFLPTNYVNRYRHLAEKASGARLVREETVPFEGKDVLCEVLEVQFVPGAESKQSSGT